jgi:hypothetical protein
MRLPAELDESDVLPVMASCGERQGGPPKKASLQYRPPNRVLVFLPKQCLLDKKVTTS